MYQTRRATRIEGQTQVQEIDDDDVIRLYVTPQKKIKKEIEEVKEVTTPPSSEEARAVPNEASLVFANQYSTNVFVRHQNALAPNAPKGRLICQERVLREYCLLKKDLMDVSFIERANPRDVRFKPMKLFHTNQVEVLAIKKHGSLAKLQAAKEKRQIAGDKIRASIAQRKEKKAALEAEGDDFLCIASPPARERIQPRQYPPKMNSKKRIRTGDEYEFGGEEGEEQIINGFDFLE